MRAVRVAYALRWLELGDGVPRLGMDKSRHRPRLTRPRSRARYPSRMRLSHLFFTTLRDDPAEAEMASHRLLLRAGYVRQLGSGIYSLLPLGKRVNDRVAQVIREEQNAIGGQEIEMPVVHPADVWRASGRYQAIGPELGRFKDRNGRDMVLAMTHEEVVGLLLGDIVKSWRQLPMQVYHFQTKWRDEPRARGGLIRVREFVMKDAYSADRDQAGLDASYEAQYGAYVRIFERLGLDVVVVASDVGIMGGSQAHEFMVLNPAGEDVLVLCESGHYAANRQVATCRSRRARRRGEAALPLEEVETPGTTTIATLAAFLGIDAARTAKAAFFVTGDGRLVTAIVRGDYEVNETKLGNAADAVGGIRPATVEEIKAAGMEPGYGSPIGAHDTFVVVDDLVERSPNLVAGANKVGFHYRNVNVGPRLHAGCRGRHHERPGGRRVPGLRRAGHPAQRHRGRQHLQARDEVHRRGRGVLPRRGRRGPARSSWAPTGSASGGTWPASSRRTTTRRGSSGRPRSRRMPPTSSRSGRPRSRA